MQKSWGFHERYFRLMQKIIYLYVLDREFIFYRIQCMMSFLFDRAICRKKGRFNGDVSQEWEIKA